MNARHQPWRHEGRGRFTVITAGVLRCGDGDAGRGLCASHGGRGHGRPRYRINQQDLPWPSAGLVISFLNWVICAVVPVVESNGVAVMRAVDGSVDCALR